MFSEVELTCCVCNNKVRYMLFVDIGLAIGSDAYGMETSRETSCSVHLFSQQDG